MSVAEPAPVLALQALATMLVLPVQRPSMQKLGMAAPPALVGVPPKAQARARAAAKALMLEQALSGLCGQALVQEDRYDPHAAQTPAGSL